MGYSCSTKANHVLEALMKIIGGESKTSNGFEINGARYFYEIGRENRDGAITGTVHKIDGPYAKRAGSFRIEPDGTITKFPGTSKATREHARSAGLMRFGAIHGGVNVRFMVGGAS